MRGYNKKQKSPWGSLGSLVAVSLEILNLNELANPFSEEKFPFLRVSWAGCLRCFSPHPIKKRAKLFTPRQLET